MNYTIREEAITLALLQEMTPLFEAHREELTAFKDIPLKVDYVRYITLYEAGAYHGFIVRDNDTNEVIGYVGYVIAPNLHYADYTYAAQDVLYVEKTKRGLMTGLKLLKYADQELAGSYNVDVVTQHSKLAQDFKPLMDRLGYKAIETIYAKRLK